MRKDNSEEIRSEYRREDLGHGIRGKYFEDYRKGTNLALLNQDVAKAFPTDEAVNDALTSLLKLAQKSVGPKERSSGRSKERGRAPK